MQYKDYYKILGVERDAGQDEIKKAYRKLARKYHPDVSKEHNAEERFKELGEAYEVLRDQEKRAAYDQLGPNWKQGENFSPPPGWESSFDFGGGFSSGGGASFSDFFESLFGQGQRRGQQSGAYGFRQSRGEDQQAAIQIDIEDSFNGAVRMLTLSEPGQRGAVGQHKLKVKIPKGIRAGQKIRLTGQGAPGIGGGPAGDLQLEVSFRPHPFYRVEGADVFLDLPVTPWEAALGATVDVPTPTGRVGVKIPAGSEQGKKLRFKGRGLPGKQAGDFYVVIKLTLPKAQTEEDRQFYAEMKERFDYNPRRHLG
ncbi:MAG: DnaJ domain-containing protein [Gammaproteobacteria bacterium]|nr:DnaJ domain-containing protein [Gammaproteobacteria bacterium]